MNSHFHLVTAFFAAVLALSPAQAQEQPAPAAYRLKPGDAVRMLVYEEADLTTQARITKGGDAAFPLIGTVALAGLTLEEATKKLHDAYAADYLVDPKVTLAIDEYVKEFVSVLGAVMKPGEVPFPERGDLDLATALAAVGGLAPQADATRVLLVRADGRSLTYGGEALKAGAARVTLAPGDRVIIG